jgi:hypothetical protein
MNSFVSIHRCVYNLHVFLSSILYWTLNQRYLQKQEKNTRVTKGLSLTTIYLWNTDLGLLTFMKGSNN